MKFNDLVIIAFLSCLCVTACSAQQTQPTFVPTQTLNPSATLKPIPTKTPTKTRSQTQSPTPTYPSYPTKRVILEYWINGWPGIFSDWVINKPSKIVLFSDRQLIISGNPFREKIVSEEEVNSLLSHLEKFGFYTIETNHKHDQTDPLYNFDGNFEEVFDGEFYCISVNTEKEQVLCAYEPFLNFLIPRMKNILNYLDNYRPDGMTVYRADRILLSINKGTDLLPEGYSPPPVDWPDNLPSLKPSRCMYVEGENAAKIFLLFNYSIGERIFVQNGIQYSVYARPVLPNEILGQP